MKEYKVVSWKAGLTKNNERLEDTLNQYGKMGWQATHIIYQNYKIIFERDKNR